MRSSGRGRRSELRPLLVGGVRVTLRSLLNGWNQRLLGLPTCSGCECSRVVKGTRIVKILGCQNRRRAIFIIDVGPVILVYWPGGGMLLLFGSRETGGMSNSKKTTKTWFQDGESGGAPNRESGRLGVRDRSPGRSRSLRLVAASLAGLVGIGAASFGAVAAQANTVAVSASSVSVLSENLASAQGLSRSLADSTIEPSASVRSAYPYGVVGQPDLFNV